MFRNHLYIYNITKRVQTKTPPYIPFVHERVLSNNLIKSGQVVHLSVDWFSYATFLNTMQTNFFVFEVRCHHQDQYQYTCHSFIEGDKYLMLFMYMYSYVILWINHGIFKMLFILTYKQKKVLCYLPFERRFIILFDDSNISQSSLLYWMFQGRIR